jgi:glycosyltransferase involved in cell wall biosynthesis
MKDGGLRTLRVLRILHVDPERGWGGGEEQVLGLACHLCAAGHRVALAAHPGAPLWRAAESAGIAAVPVAVRNALDFRAAQRLRALLAGVDVVHFHTARAHALALWLGTGGTPARVVTRRMDYPPAPRSYARLLYNRRVDRVVAISSAIRDVLVAAGVEAARITVIPSGIDVERFAAAEGERERVRRDAWGVDAADCVVLVVGALVERKGHAVLLAAARALADQGVRLRYVFCGDGVERRALEARARDLALGARVHFLGFRRDVPALLAGADVVAVPSLHEGLGVAALEAMAAARAVVASRVGGLVEVVRHGTTGWLVPPGDAAVLAAALAAAAGDAAQRRAFGAAGRARVAAEFTMARMAAANEAVYREIVEASGPRRGVRGAAEVQSAGRG